VYIRRRRREEEEEEEEEEQKKKKTMCIQVVMCLPGPWAGSFSIL